jgi:hypothetical protein
MKSRLYVLALFAVSPLLGQQLTDPVQVMCGNQPINVDVGHATPFMGDLDGDGLPDLIVGQYGLGQARVYRNVGTKDSPRFESFEWFKAGGEVARVWTD